MNRNVGYYSWGQPKKGDWLVHCSIIITSRAENVVQMSVPILLRSCHRIWNDSIPPQLIASILEPDQNFSCPPPSCACVERELRAGRVGQLGSLAGLSPPSMLMNRLSATARVTSSEGQCKERRSCRAPKPTAGGFHCSPVFTFLAITAEYGGDQKGTGLLIV